jgi:hypothetical protein
MAIEIVAGVLVVLLALVSTAALYIGMCALFGLTRFVRCRDCRSLTFTATEDRACLSCRHRRLMHPGAMLHHVRLAHHGGDHLG